MTGRLRLGDLGSEAVAGLAQRPVRSMLTMVGTVLGIGAFVSILGVTGTANGQISSRFNALTATQVTVQDVGDPDNPTSPPSFPGGASQTVAALPGVVSAGVTWAIDSPVTISDHLFDADSDSSDDAGLDLTAAEPGALTAMGASDVEGRLYDGLSETRALRVAVLGSVVAQRLGISRVDSQPAVFLNGTPYLVVGIVQDFTRQPGAALSLFIPTTTADQDFGEPVKPRASMQVVTRLGAAQVVAHEVATALRPDSPQLFQVIAPADPTTLRTGVGADVNGLYLVLAAVSLIIGALGIVNTTLVAVFERTPEIGLRRALGALPRHIAIQFLAESLALGFMGGLIGASVGVMVVLTTAIARSWTAILPTWVILAAPLGGALVGLLAGIYPALRAARIAPVQALQR